MRVYPDDDRRRAGQLGPRFVAGELERRDGKIWVGTTAGVYVYRDRIRILPYGNSDVDWLDIEERRTKGASYYFFSHTS